MDMTAIVRSFNACFRRAPQPAERADVLRHAGASAEAVQPGTQGWHVSAGQLISRAPEGM